MNVHFIALLTVFVASGSCNLIDNTVQPPVQSAPLIDRRIYQNAGPASSSSTSSEFFDAIKMINSPVKRKKVVWANLDALTVGWGNRLRVLYSSILLSLSLGYPLHIDLRSYSDNFFRPLSGWGNEPQLVHDLCKSHGMEVVYLNQSRVIRQRGYFRRLEQADCIVVQEWRQFDYDLSQNELVEPLLFRLLGTKSRLSRIHRVLNWVLSEPKPTLENAVKAEWDRVAPRQFKKRIAVHLRTFYDDPEWKRNPILQGLDSYWKCVHELLMEHFGGSSGEADLLILFASDSPQQKLRAKAELAGYGTVVSADVRLEHSLLSDAHLVEWMMISQCADGQFNVGSTWSSMAYPRSFGADWSVSRGPSRFFNTPLAGWGYMPKCERVEMRSLDDIILGDPGEHSDCQAPPCKLLR